MTHSFQTRVYYEDTDLAGIVYYANYLKFAERARTEALRSLGINQTELMANDGIGFVVRHCEIDFLKPAAMDDLLTIKTDLRDISRVKLLMQQTICRGEETLVTLAVTLAVIGADKRPTKLPEQVHSALIALKTT